MASFSGTVKIMYRLRQNSIQRISDGAYIPEDSANTDYREYLDWLANGNTPEVVPEPVYVPQAVTRRQARQELASRGLLSTVQACINSIPDATMRELLQIEWDDSLNFERSRPSLIALATNPAPYGLGLTEADLDAIFIAAAERA
jgi:hypothetical protein